MYKLEPIGENGTSGNKQPMSENSTSGRDRIFIKSIKMKKLERLNNALIIRECYDTTRKESLIRWLFKMWIV